MPICPYCSTTIHAGAEQCPSCGYSLLRADAAFGDQDVEFTRVVDAAGALRHRERMDLMKYLEDLERSLPPVALCVYITDEGKLDRFRAQAHWILNHARIHHPAFGPREKQHRLEGAELRERRQDEPAPELAPKEPHAFLQFFDSLKNYLRNAMHPYAPPVQHEWMLILVIDVQLEVACFSWGYMLDPYVNPDTINCCIVKARLQFRERELLTGIKKVMRLAVKNVGGNALKVNRKPSRFFRFSFSLPLLALLAGGALLASPLQAAPQGSNAAKKPAAAKPAAKAASKPAAKPTAKPSSKPAAKPTAKPVSKPAAKPQPPKPAQRTAAKPAASQASAAAKPAAEKDGAKPAAAFADDELAEELPEDESAEELSSAEATAAKPAPALEAAEGAKKDEPKAEEPQPDAAQEELLRRGVPASYAGPPHWKAEDYKALMAGELGNAYAALLPEGKALPAKSAAVKSPAKPSGKASAKGKAKLEESRLPACNKPSPGGLCDPLGVLSSLEREDLEHTLRHLNANSRFRIYLALAPFSSREEIPAECSAGSMVTAAAQPAEYAVLLFYPVGLPEELQLGYQEMKLDDAQRHEWMQHAREAAQQAGGGVEGMMAALARVHADIEPLSSSFREILPGAAVLVDKIDIRFREKAVEKKHGIKEIIKELSEDETKAPYLEAAAVVLLLLLLAGFGIYSFCRRKGRLLPSTADLRLASPYGASISRYVRYLEGKEASKEKRLF